MLKERVEELESAILEIEGRAMMHDVFIAHLLGRIGSVSGDIEGFINGVLPMIGNDLQENAARASDDTAKERCAFALEAFANFAMSMESSLKRAHKGELN
ncbi:hypothetical protein [Rhizobium sp. WW_1]|jgi:hypothetical protein|uniref:hypothetical protein n=1 Tax=Rhizobium sp. WW_1 TaxID=1907375 RepID=UPI000646596B|nr:hypothetical protein [Rhizobium sp. WW_1]RKD61573.1 hypothetical protein BJ928_107174 [Rhizobium sp. WW_1]